MRPKSPLRSRLRCVVRRDLPRLELQLRDVAEPVAEPGWYACFGYGEKPLVIYATRGQTEWRVGMRQVPITYYAGPLTKKEAT